MFSKQSRVPQLQHGLRHEDYERYRGYCARKLRRLYKAMKMTHGRGKYTKRALDVKNVSDVGHLMILLVSAERAWAHAMQLKSSVEGGGPGANRHRHHGIRRMTKAATWAAVLADAARGKGRPRTALEAAAYADWLAGTSLLDRARLSAAVARLERSQAILQVLSGIGSLEEQELAHQKQSEVEQQLRFARYEAERKGAGSKETAQPMEDVEPHPSWQELAKQLEEEGEAGVPTSGAKGAGPTFLSWRGQTFPVRADRVRASLQVALQGESELDAAIEAGGPQYAGQGQEGL
eukprot:jgi/Botrbrau1/16591/Bobra.0068s0021.1